MKTLFANIPWLALILVLCLALSLACSSCAYIPLYKPKSPLITKIAIGGVIDTMKKSEEILFANLQTIRTETCRLDADYRDYVAAKMKRELDLQFGERFCPDN